MLGGGVADNDQLLYPTLKVFEEKPFKYIHPIARNKKLKQSKKMIKQRFGIIPLLLIFSSSFLYCRQKIKLYYEITNIISRRNIWLA